jgi:hypothetical protein
MKRASFAPVSPEYDRVIESDRRFFARWPQRQMRFRRAHRDETVLCPWIPPNLKWFALVRQIRDGIRLRSFYGRRRTWRRTLVTPRYCNFWVSKICVARPVNGARRGKKDFCRD